MARTGAPRRTAALGDIVFAMATAFHWKLPALKRLAEVVGIAGMLLEAFLLLWRCLRPAGLTDVMPFARGMALVIEFKTAGHRNRG